MPATQFICPKTKKAVKIAECLKECGAKQRCMFLPTLRSVAESLNRKLDKPSVTELIAGTRETYLKKTQPYGVLSQNDIILISQPTARLTKRSPAR